MGITETTKKNEYMKKQYLYSEITNRIMKCAIEFHNFLEPGFMESIYENALLEEMKQNGLKVENQVLVPIFYNDKEVGRHRLDLVVENLEIVENKTVKEFDKVYHAKVLLYLKDTVKRIGLLINFAKMKIKAKRIIL